MRTDKTREWITYTRNDFGYQVKIPKGLRTSDIPTGFDNLISETRFNLIKSSIGIYYGVKQRNFTNIDSYLEYWKQNSLPSDMPYTIIKLRTGQYAIYKYDYLSDGKKFGITLGTFGKKYDYSISFGNPYNSSLFTPEEEQKFWLFVNTFKLLPENRI